MKQGFLEDCHCLFCPEIGMAGLPVASVGCCMWKVIDVEDQERLNRSMGLSIQ